MHRILDELPFGQDGRVIVDAHFQLSLEDAVALYIRSRQEALDQVYKSQVLDKSRSGELEADFEEVAASCGYFSFSLLDFANEMTRYLEILDELKLEVEERPSGRSWNWLKIWRRFLPSDLVRAPDDAGTCLDNLAIINIAPSALYQMAM